MRGNQADGDGAERRADADRRAPEPQLDGAPLVAETQAGSAPTPHGHVPVLVRRVDELLAPAIAAATRSGAQDVVLVDATLGMGGHTLALLTAHPGLRVIGIDRDPQALRIAERSGHP